MQLLLGTAAVLAVALIALAAFDRQPDAAVEKTVVRAEDAVSDEAAASPADTAPAEEPPAAAPEEPEPAAAAAKPAAKKVAASAKAPAAEKGELVIPLGGISAKASFYPVKVDGTDLEVIAVKAPDGTIRTAFNTCQICYDSGRGYYKQEGDQLVCQNCGNRFGMEEVELSKGGCNPVPITAQEKTVTDSAIIISKDFLAEATEIFANWKI